MSKGIGKARLDVDFVAWCALACAWAALLAGCASGGPPNPDAQACLAEAPAAKGGSN